MGGAPRSGASRAREEAEAGRAVRLTRRGVFVAVLVGRRQYEQWTTPARRFSTVLAEFARAVDLAELDIDPDEVFAEARPRAPGRDVRL